MYVLRGSTIRRLTSASFQRLDDPLEGMWKNVTQWPAFLDKLSCDSSSATVVTFGEASTCFIDRDGSVEEDVSAERIVETMQQRFGPLMAALPSRAEGGGVPTHDPAEVTNSIATKATGVGDVPRERAWSRFWK